MIGRRGFFRLLGAAAVGSMIPLPAPAYELKELSVPITWGTRAPVEAEKVALVKSLLERAIMAHDDILEQTLFNTGQTNDIRGLPSWVEGAGDTLTEAGVTGGDDDAGFW